MNPLTIIQALSLAAALLPQAQADVQALVSLLKGGAGLADPTPAEVELSILRTHVLVSQLDTDAGVPATPAP